MPVGINNVTTIVMDNITDLVNISDPGEFLVKANWMIYGGWLYFILLWVFWLILYMSAQANDNQPLVNAMYGGIIVSIVSIILRGIYITINGTVRGMITDSQLWVFPLITLLIASWLWANRRE